MDAQDFVTLVDGLAADAGVDTDWRPLRLVEDSYLAWGEGGEPDLIVATLPTDAGASPFDWLRDNAADLIAGYYRTHPLTERGFNDQVRGLVACHGAPAVAAPAGRRPPRTLFVDAGSVLALSVEDPRHAYGSYCELPGGRGAEDVEAQVARWIESGEAYAGYLAMNVCRYNC